MRRPGKWARIRDRILGRSPARAEAARRRQLQAERAAYLERVKAAAAAHGLELQPWQLDVAAVQFERGQKWQAANPGLGHRVKWSALGHMERGPDA